jgi:hypothetical protein
MAGRAFAGNVVRQVDATRPGKPRLYPLSSRASWVLRCPRCARRAAQRGRAAELRVSGRSLRSGELGDDPRCDRPHDPARRGARNHRTARKAERAAVSRPHIGLPLTAGDNPVGLGPVTAGALLA